MLTTITETFFPAPGSPVGALTIRHCSRHGWRVLRETVAGELGCDEDELSTTEVVYRDGDASAECVIYAGRIIGAVDWPVAAEDWPAIFEAHRAMEFVS